MQYSIPIEIIEMEAENFHLVVESVFFNGSTGKWIIDTGASKTVLDKTLNLHYNESEAVNDNEILSAGIGEKLIETSEGIIPDLDFNGMVLENLKVALIDLSHINNLYKKYSEITICGLIGSDFLHKYKAIIDYSEKKLILNF